MAVILVKNIVIIFLTALQFAMLVRAILSWFPSSPAGISDFLHAITEPFIAPIRMLFDRMNWFSGLPIDISFLVTYFLITVLLIILP
jgi:YggT family protein